MYLFVYTRINAQNDQRKIWVPPKPKPSLPFGLGPAPEPLKPEDFSETTYKEYEIKQLQDAVQQLVTGCAISFFMGYQFKVYMSLLIQSASLPMNIFDNLLFKKHVLGVVKGADGGELYGEQFKQPSVQSIEIAERLAIARAAGVGKNSEVVTPEKKLSPSIAVSAIAEDEPRVEEISVDAAADGSQ
jgi:hypothetical protein